MAEVGIAAIASLELMVGAGDFWTRARQDIAASRQRVLLQAMTFEGDATGVAVAAALRSSPADDRRVLVDDYTRLNVNDTDLASRAARRDAALQAEVRATANMFRDLGTEGVPVRVTNPIDRLRLNYPCRNHKKLIVADDVAYIGGVNFSDHNFAWPDLMLRIQDSASADFLADDFDRTFRGAVEPVSFKSGSFRLMALDGRANAGGFSEVFARIAAAKREITVVSPYLTAPFSDALGAAVRKGVAVQLLTPWPNNKPIVRNALLWSAEYHGFNVKLGPTMNHLKGMLIDCDTLILGSSNFDFASLAAEEEFLAIVDDPDVIRDFETRVVLPALASAIDRPDRQNRSRGRAAYLALRLAALVASAAKGFPRTAVDWPSPACNSRRTLNPELRTT